MYNSAIHEDFPLLSLFEDLPPTEPIWRLTPYWAYLKTYPLLRAYLSDTHIIIIYKLLKYIIYIYIVDRQPDYLVSGCC